MIRPPLLATVAALALAGCTTLGPEPTRPNARVDLAGPYANASDPRAADSLAAGVPAMARWWTALGDPELDALVDEALARNLDVEAAVARVRQARAQRRIAGADRLPTLDGIGVAQRSRTSENIFGPIGAGAQQGGGQTGGQPGGGQGGGQTGGQPGGGQPGGGQAAGLPGTENDFFQAGFDASWELDLWGRNRRGVQAAGARLQAAAYGLEDVRLSLISDVVRDYVQLREAQVRLATAGENLAAARRTAEVVRERERGGLVTGLDLTRAEAAATQLEALVPQFEIQIRQSAQRLAVLTAREPGALLDRLERPSALAAVPRRVATGMPSELLERRPDIRRAQADLDALTYDIGVARADLYPRFTLDGTFGLQSTTAGNLLEWGSRYWSFGLNVFAPLFDGDRRRATVDLRRAQAEEGLANYRLAVLRAFQDVEDALVAFDRDHDRLAAHEREVAQRSRAVVLAQERYRAGLINLLDVLQAEQDLFAARDRAVAARAAIAADWAALQKALGGGWSPPADIGEARS